MKVFASLLFFTILTPNLYADLCEETYSFYFPTGKKEVCLLKKNKALVTHECLGAKKCQALKSLSTKKLSAITLTNEELEGGKSPETLLCKKLTGTLILAKTNLGHDEFFCEFKDKSMISVSSQYSKYQDLK